MHAIPRKKDFIHVCLKQLESYEGPHINTCMTLVAAAAAKWQAAIY